MDFIKITLLAIIMIFVGNIENRISDMASNFGGNGVGSNVLYEFGLGSEAFYQPQALEVFDFSKLFLSQGVLHEPAFAKGFKQADFVGG